MLKSVRMQNFFSFKDCTIEFDPNVNLLIGINGSGKSNLLKVISLLKDSISGKGLRNTIRSYGGFDGIAYCGNGHEERDCDLITLEYTFAPSISKGGVFPFKESIIYSITIKKQGSTSNYTIDEKLQTEGGFIYIDFHDNTGNITEKESSYAKPRIQHYSAGFEESETILSQLFDPDRYPYQATVKNALKNISIYNYFNTTPQSPMRNAVESVNDVRLEQDGTNLPQVLNKINISDKEQYRRIIELFQSVNDKYSDIDFHFVAGRIELMIEEKGLKRSIHVSQISDGTLHYLCNLAIACNPDRGNLICIDEPETGLHPDMIYNLSEEFINVSNDSQFIIATHSEDFIDKFDFENIIVLEKGDDNSTYIKKFTENNFKDWYDEYHLGKMWRAGDLGGNRW